LSQKRELFRVAIDRAGHIQRGVESVPCRIVDVTEKGVRLRVEGSFSTGDLLHLEFALTKRALITCTLKVTFARPPLVGAVIVDISSHDQTLLAHFIDEINAINLSGF
jgi:PilZ domain-containing protein